MLTIATVLRSGGIYTPLWVQRLAAQCVRHAPPHRFVCLSDMVVPGVVTTPLLHGWPGWWSKIEALQLRGPLLYLDLDTLVVGDLSDICAAAARHAFTMLRDFYRPDGLGSGVMAWNDRDVSTVALYGRFLDDPDGWMVKVGGRGDQGFIEDAAYTPGITRWQDIVPGQIASWKADRCADGPPAGARLLCFHGDPKQSTLPAASWARRQWEAAA